MAKIREETKSRIEKEKKIVLSGLDESEKEEVKDQELDDRLKLVEILKVQKIQDPCNEISKVYRKGKKSGRNRLVVVELKSHDIKKEIIKNARFLSENEHYKDVYINKD